MDQKRPQNARKEDFIYSRLRKRRRGRSSTAWVDVVGADGDYRVVRRHMDPSHPLLVSRNAIAMQRHEPVVIVIIVRNR
jgi:hypothetical protein